LDHNTIIDQNKESILQTYHELHLLAEPSWKEQQTSHYLQKQLLEAGLEVRTFEGHFGFIAEIKGESNEVVALRADMDALMQEVDGEVKANHSCGHDAHSTLVLHTALTLAKLEKPKHTYRFIFQPAEEKAEGALQMMKDGALKDVKFLGGVHLRPKIEIPYGVASPVILHGSTATLRGTITGTPAHAARPEEGINPIEVASLLIQAVQQIRIRNSKRYSIKITELHSGEASNLIPHTARFTFDLRADTNEAMDQLIEKGQHAIETIAQVTGATITFSLGEFSPAAIENQVAMKLAEKAITATLGEENFVPTLVSPGAEDFHFYTLKNPNVVATLIGLGCDLTPGLHHPQMTFNIEALIYGTKILTKLMLEADKQSWS